MLLLLDPEDIAREYPSFNQPVDPEVEIHMEDCGVLGGFLQELVLDAHDTLEGPGGLRGLGSAGAVNDIFNGCFVAGEDPLHLVKRCMNVRFDV